MGTRAPTSWCDSISSTCSIHNSGIVNKIYLDKAGTKARYATGEKVVIDRPYFDDTWALAKKLVDDIAAAAKLRLSKAASP